MVWLWPLWYTAYSAFGFKSSLPGALDLLFILLESGGMHIRLSYRPVSDSRIFEILTFRRTAIVPLATIQKIDPQDFGTNIRLLPWNYISYIVFAWILCLSLLTLALLRITEALTRGRKFWVTRYDVTGKRVHSSASISSPPGAAEATNFWLGGIYVLFGRSTWKKVFLWVFPAACITHYHVNDLAPGVKHVGWS